MIERINRSAPVALLVLLLTVIIACSEQVSGSIGCPELCTDESAALRDTILVGGIAVDSSLLGYPGFGQSRDITLLNQGDSADVRFISRFDVLPTNYTPLTAQPDSLIKLVDSAQYLLYIDTTTVKPITPFTVEAYDVDTTAADTAFSALIPLFRANRLLGSRTFLSGDIKDTLKIPLDNAKLLAKIRDTLKLRVGLRITGLGSTRLRVLASTVLPRVRFRVATDTLVKPDTVFVNSSTPVEDANIASALAVYPIVVKGKLAQPPVNLLAIGGLSGSRTYLKFNIPRTVIDSVTVVRASLLLNQLPARSTARTGDTLTVFTHPILSSPKITDVRTAINFMGSPYDYGVDSVRFAVKDSGARSIELVRLFRFWRAIGDSNTVRAIVLRAEQEGTLAGELNFSSIEAANAALRPRLRITYVPRRGFGLP